MSTTANETSATATFSAPAKNYANNRPQLRNRVVKATERVKNDSNVLDVATLAKELALLKAKVAQLERGSSSWAKGTTNSGGARVADGFTTATFTISPRNVERCGVGGFFVLGSIVGASLLDRLWLIGGLAAGYWAATNARSPSRYGVWVRRLGARMALFIKDIVEMYNQFVVYYKTGKLAYASSQRWDKYDKQWGITEKLDSWKQSVVARSSKLGESATMEQVRDMWSALLTAPKTANRINREYGITQNVGLFFRGVTSSIGDTFRDMVDEGRDRAGYGRQRRRYTRRPPRRMRRGGGPWWRPAPRKSRGNDPWAGPCLPSSSSSRRKSRTW